MIITYADEFIKKSSIPGYPMRGYWIQFGPKLDTNNIGDINSINLALYSNWNNSKSDLISCNTFLTDNNCRISFDIVNYNDKFNTKEYIYLFALDLLVTRDITSLSSIGRDLFKHLAGIIDLEYLDIDSEVTTIIDLEYVPKCSFLVNSGTGMRQVEHYNGYELGQTNVYSPDLKNNQLIEYNSAMNKVRQTLSYDKPHELAGSFTIRKSGLIQL